VNGTSSYPQTGERLISVVGAVTSPGTRYYQVWYRNSVTCHLELFNLSNGWTITWVP